MAFTSRTAVMMVLFAVLASVRGYALLSQPMDTAKLYGPVNTSVRVDDKNKSTDQFSDLAVTPDPFVEKTSISFAVNRATWMYIDIFNCQGKLVKQMGYSFSKPGVKQLAWDGRNESGIKVNNGFYVIKIESENKFKSIPVLLVQ
jgi:flagellar hook assembly protein FlgD